MRNALEAEDGATDREHLRRAAALAGIDTRRLVGPRRHHRVLRALRLHSLDWGTRGLPPVIFLHGGLLTAHTWDLVCLALRDAYHCRALDQRGHGDSEWSPELDYRPAAYLADLEAFVEDLRLDRFVLVGQSMGGLHTLQYAGAHAERLAGIVVVDVPADFRETEGLRRLRAFSREPIADAGLDDLVERAKNFNPRRDRQLLRRSLLHNLRRRPDGRWMWKYDPRLVEGGLGDLAARLDEAREAAPRITCPALVVHGAQSDLVSEQESQRLASLLPRGAWAQVPDAGHTVQGDNPSGLAALLRATLAGWFATTPSVVSLTC